jgi:hypothetical protein
VSTRNYGPGDSNLRELSLSPSNVPFRNYIPSLTERYTAHSRNGKLYLSSGTGPCKLETDDVRVNLSRISLWLFWIVKYFFFSSWRRLLWWLRMNQLWNTGNTRKKTLHLRTDADTFLYARRVAAECSVLMYRPLDARQKDSDATSFLATAAKCVNLIQCLKLNDWLLWSRRLPHPWRWDWGCPETSVV